MYLLAVVFMTMYQIDKKTHQDILAELEAKRAYSAGMGSMQADFLVQRLGDVGQVDGPGPAD